MTMDKRDQWSSSKKSRVESTQVQVKQEMEERGGGATVAVEATAPREELSVKIYKDKIHCPVCTLPFKPPIFQCEAGHSACSACHALLPKDRCYACCRDGAYRCNTTLEDVVRWHRILCPYEGYGCRTYVTYHDAGNHQFECPWAPCKCSELGCTFVGSLPMLCDHLAAAPHSWPVDKIRYDSLVDLRLPVSLPRRLLVAEEDGRVFLLSSCAMGSSFRGASVVCIRASAAAGPKYTCTMCAVGNKSKTSGRAEIVVVQT